MSHGEAIVPYLTLVCSFNLLLSRHVGKGPIFNFWQQNFYLAPFFIRLYMTPLAFEQGLSFKFFPV